MIRLALIITGFFGITLALVFLQPGPRGTYRDFPAQTSVTRESTIIDEPVVMQTDPNQYLPTAQDQRSVDQVMAEVAAATARAANPVDNAVVTATRPQMPNIGATVPPAPELRQMSYGILQSLNASSGTASAPGDPGSLLYTIVQRSMTNGLDDSAQSDPYMQSLRAQALRRAAEPAKN